MVEWKAILMIYPAIDVSLPLGWLRNKEFKHQLNQSEVDDALEAWKHFPDLAYECSEGEATIITDTVYIERTLNSLTAMGDKIYWPSPADTKPEIDRIVKPGKYDSIFVYWPLMNAENGEVIPSGGWGLGMGPTAQANNCTYAAVGNSAHEDWIRPRIGEIWLHEWLHGVCNHFSNQGFQMPSGDADGGGRSGYTQSEEHGWTDYYRDLMCGNVNTNGQGSGITTEAWRTGSIVDSQA
jgi:hypothetical protein